MRLRRKKSNDEAVLKPYDWALRGPFRGLRNDLQQLLLFPFVRWFARIKVEGKEHLKDLGGPVVIISNHSSHLDCPVILAALPNQVRQRTLVAAAADYFYKTKTLGFLTSLAVGAIPFQRHEGARESLENCKEALRRGWSVLIFPEGTRSKTGELGEFRPGASFLALDSMSATLPVRIVGAHDLMPKGRFLPRKGRVTVRFGPPVGVKPGETYEQYTERLWQAVANLAL